VVHDDVHVAHQVVVGQVLADLLASKTFSIARGAGCA
jgi:hypothetical protein